MQVYEYKVMPAPNKGRKVPGIKGVEARFSNMLQELMNELAVDGWEYQRADVLPSEERQGLTSSRTVYRSVLVFRRALVVEEPEIDEPKVSIENPDDFLNNSDSLEEALISEESMDEPEEKPQNRD